MDKQKHKLIHPWLIWLFSLIVLVSAGVWVFCSPVLGIDEMTMLASTSSRDLSKPVEPDANINIDRNSMPPVQQPANTSVHAVTEAAVRLGVLTCLKRINQVTTFLTANSKSGVLILPVADQPDQHIFSASFEIMPPDNSTVYASASFFPNNDAVYDTVQYVDRSPEELQRTVFKHLQRKNILKKNIILLDGGAVKVFLMPAGSGTVVIKKEIVW
jgi:hypothetical protein